MYYWVIYHCVTGNEILVTRFSFLARFIYYFVPSRFTLEFYPHETYKNYSGWII